MSPAMDGYSLSDLVAQIRTCRICRDTPLGPPLPHEPRPVLQISSSARVLIAGQAPGTRVHRSGRPFTDASGDRLRHWLGMDEATFYDDTRVAIVPMGFCFPGLDEKGADRPPRPECARHWHDRLFALAPQADLIIAVGLYAHRYHFRRLGLEKPASLTESVTNWRAAAFRNDGPAVFALPHPSWRNNGWLRQHPWFEAEVLPALQSAVAARL